jgi:hypothetical protein
MSLNVIKSNTPGQQALTRLYENDLTTNGKSERGIFNTTVIQDIFTNTHYQQELLLGNTLATYTNWSHVDASDGYSVWKYPVSGYVDANTNQLYRNDILLSYQGEASSESTLVGFNKVFRSDSKRTGESFTDITTEATSASGTPFQLVETTVVTNEVVSAIFGSINLDYLNILEGTLSVNNQSLTSSYIENLDYSMDYKVGTVTILSTGNISSGAQLYVSYEVGNTMYIGSSGTFGNLNFDLATKGVGNVYAYDYWSGTWASFTPTLDSTNNASNNGNVVWSASGLTGWTTTTVSASNLYWIKMRLTVKGMIFPTGYHLVKADSAATKLVAMSQTDLEETNYKWAYYNNNVYVTIPNQGDDINEGVTFIKSTSDTTKLSTFFVNNNTYITNYYLGSSGDISFKHNMYVSGNLTVGGNFNISGAIVMSGDLGIDGRIFLASGTASEPAFTFTNASGYGMYLDGNDLAFTTNGTKAISINSSQNSTFGGIIKTSTGVASGPAYSFTSDPDTGMYLFANLIRFAYGGAQKLGIETDRIYAGTGSPAQPILRFGTGLNTASSPAYTFGSDEDTGMYRSNSDEISFATGGNQALKLDSSQNIDIPNGDLRTVAWTDYSSTSTLTGWSSYTIKEISYKKVGNLVFVNFKIYGVSDSTLARFTVPYSASSFGNGVNIPIRVRDNSGSRVVGIMFLNNSSNIVQCLSDITGSSFTASGTKEIEGSFYYES